MKSSNKNSGYTLLFAVLTAALVLGVSTFILGVSRKQYALSSAARSSMYSFYAADSGIECIISGINQPSAYSLLLATSSSAFTFRCADQDLSMTYNMSVTSGSKQTWEASTTIGFSSSGAPASKPLWGCASVVIDQSWDNSSGDYQLAGETVTSRGYNSCSYDSSKKIFAPTPSQLTVERALQWNM